MTVWCDPSNKSSCEISNLPDSSVNYDWFYIKVEPIEYNSISAT